MKKHDAVKYFLGLNIGSSACKVALARVSSWDDFSLEIMAVESQSYMNVVERGCIVNMEKISNYVGEMIEVIRKRVLPQESDLNCISGIISLEDRYIQSRVNRAVYPFSRHIREVQGEDLIRAKEMASNFPLKNGMEYLHIMPRSYRVDNRLPKRDPEGELGSSVESEVFLVSAPKKEILKYKQCADKVRIPLDYICAGPIATAEGVLTRLEKEQSVILIDIGADTTSTIIFDNGVPKDVSIVPFGGNDITRDIAHVLHIPEAVAEKIKKNYGCVDPMYFPQFPQTITIREEEYDQTFSVDVKKVYEIAYARMYEIFKFVYTATHLLEHAHTMLVVVTGGASKILGCKQMLEKITRAKTRMAQPWNWGGPLTKYRDPHFSNVIGLCAVGAQRYYTKQFHYNEENNKGNIHYTSHGKVQELFHSIGGTFRKFFSLGNIEY